MRFFGGRWRFLLLRDRFATPPTTAPREPAGVWLYGAQERADHLADERVVRLFYLESDQSIIEAAEIHRSDHPTR
ncbi:MAG TPA: hypothetical protein VLI65_04385 [Pyrinomonadaceae bacterium]|nr:hypothetical protein [Pyrinomonadaceae bacterium]